MFIWQRNYVINIKLYHWDAVVELNIFIAQLFKLNWLQYNWRISSHILFHGFYNHPAPRLNTTHYDDYLRLGLKTTMSPLTIRPPSVLISLDGSSGLGDRPLPPISQRQRWLFTRVRFRWSTDTAPHLDLKDLHTSLQHHKGAWATAAVPHHPAWHRHCCTSKAPPGDRMSPAAKATLECGKAYPPPTRPYRTSVLAAMATRQKWADQVGPEVLQTPFPLKKLHRWTASKRTRVRNQCSRLDVRAEGGPV